MFGRTEDENVCPHQQIQTTKCTSPDSEVKVKIMCEGKPQCSILVIPATFGGDPCRNTYKYLEVNFICY